MGFIKFLTVRNLNAGAAPTWTVPEVLRTVTTPSPTEGHDSPLLTMALRLGVPPAAALLRGVEEGLPGSRLQDGSMADSVSPAVGEGRRWGSAGASPYRILRTASMRGSGRAATGLAHCKELAETSS